ncbi:hypothetical protein HMSSN036_74140 [Paenibacillus macerans]|nr:hypothetical protein HMSSN036_74140 [Paenibacillus macerans]
MSGMHTRGEYPRPQFERSLWLNLNGEWQFQFDDKQVGVAEQWFKDKILEQKIRVPFCYQSKLSGIGVSEFHDTVWYKRTVDIPEEMKGKRIILHFGAVDYASRVWVNGHMVAAHEGGHTPFAADITDALKESGPNVITLRAQDFSRDVTLPRGKQYWREKSELIFYTSTTGIWQPVWIEAVEPIHLRRVYYYPDIDRNEIGIQYVVEGWTEDTEITIRTQISFEGETLAVDECKMTASRQKRRIELHDFNDHGMGRWWSPEHPHLYDVEYRLYAGGALLDTVRSYFGMRKVSVDSGKLCLNNRPFYMKAILDQGYFPGGILTAPADEDLRRDVELTKQMGFNGVRKHQKIEDPRFLYWCDKLGLVVWGEAANAYAFSESYVKKFTAEWAEAVDRDFNSPSIITWVPLNESWGIPNVKVDEQQRQHAIAMYHSQDRWIRQDWSFQRRLGARAIGLVHDPRLPVGLRRTNPKIQPDRNSAGCTAKSGYVCERVSV